MHKLLFILSLVLVFSACRPAREIGRTVSDSSRIERITEYRDTTIQVPADSSWLEALIECDSTGKAYLKEIAGYKTGKQSTLPSVRIQDNMLKVDCKCDSVAIYHKLSRIYDHSSQVRVEKETVTVEANRLSWWQKTQIYAFRIMGGLFLLYVSIIIIKRFVI